MPGVVPDENGKNWKAFGDPTGGAVVITAGRKAGLDVGTVLETIIPESMRSRSIRGRKRMTTINSDGTQQFAYIKGATNRF